MDLTTPAATDTTAASDGAGFGRSAGGSTTAVPVGPGPVRPAPDSAPATPAAPRADLVGLPDSTARIGVALTFQLLPECRSLTTAEAGPPVAEGPDPAPSPGATPTPIAIEDIDQSPDTFTLDTGQLAVGSYVLHFRCRGGVTAQTRVLIYQQNGAARGEADSILIAGGVGLASVAALVGLPPAGEGRSRRNRRGNGER